MDLWFPILIGVIALYMCLKYPTGVGGDPFPYELRPGRVGRFLINHADLFETLAWALVVWAASVYLIWRTAP